MAYEDILRVLCEILEDDFDYTDVEEDTTFLNDLQLSEEEYETFAKYIKEELDIEVTQDILDDCQTVGDLATYIEENIFLI